jgi:hypothetical protein
VVTSISIVNNLIGMTMCRMVVRGRNTGNHVAMTFSTIEHDGRGNALRGERNHHQPYQHDF